MEAGIIFAACIVIFTVCYLIWFINYLRKHPPKSQEEREKEKKLTMIETMYRCGKLTFAEYDVLTAKYTGTKSLTEQVGLGVVMAASNKIAAEKAVEQQVKQANKNLIYNAALGSAIGGAAGAVIGAATSANQSEIKTQQALEAQAKANQEYQEAIRNYVENK